MKPLIRTLAVVVAGALGATLIAVTPAAASGGTKSITQAVQTVQKSATATIPVDQVKQTLSQITVQRLGDSGTAAPAAGFPICGDVTDTIQWAYISLNVQWSFDVQTRITLSSRADWWGWVYCHGMSALGSGSNLFFRGQPASPLGTHGLCGEQGAPTGDCGYAPTSGTSYCVGLGNCGGDYAVTLGVWVELPLGYFWGSIPPACSANDRMMLCSWRTDPPVFVPNVNT